MDDSNEEKGEVLSGQARGSSWELPSLFEREEEFLELIDQNPQPLMIADRESLQFLAVNKAASTHYGFSPEEFLSMDLQRISPQDDLPILTLFQSSNPKTPVLCSICGDIREHRKRESEFVEIGLCRHVRRDGSLILVKVFAQAIRFQQRTVWLILVKDVTAREREHETLQLLVDVVAAAAEAPDTYAITSRCLETICKGTGWPVGQAWFLDEEKIALVCSSSYYSDFDIRDFRAESLVTSLLRGADLPGKVWASNAPVWLDGSGLEMQTARLAAARKVGLNSAFGFPIYDKDQLIAIFEFFSAESRLPDRHLLEALEKVGVHLAVVFQRKKEEQALRHQAFHDLLTGLPNRVLFKDRLTQALAQALRKKQSLALVFLDIDHFKEINDTYGHHVGDELLKAIAMRLCACLRETDTVVRLGGDEFVILLTEIVEDTPRVAQKILDAFRPVFKIDGHKLHVTTSVGVSVFPYDGKDGRTLMKNADVALYRAKENGRNNYQMYTPAMTASAVARLNLENNLRRAIKNHEFSLYFQPLIEMKSGAILSAEALLRWEHPELGLFMPEEFIPLAEDTGLITPIWEWALRSACLQLKSWQEAQIGPRAINMNISSYQFKHPKLVPNVMKILEETGVDPKTLIFEITEGMAMKADFAATLLLEFRHQGIQISIDDFGTGYSSLGQLKRFPIDYLKIDPCFVRELPTDSNDQAIVTSIIALAHGLHMKVIAEGVETVEQLNVLRTLQCDAVQGYLICRPMPVKQLTNLFRHGFDALPG